MFLEIHTAGKKLFGRYILNGITFSAYKYLLSEDLLKCGIIKTEKSCLYFCVFREKWQRQFQHSYNIIIGLIHVYGHLTIWCMTKKEGRYFVYHYCESLYPLLWNNSSGPLREERFYVLIQNDQPDGKLSSSSSIVVCTQEKNVNFFFSKRLHLYCVLIWFTSLWLNYN